MKMRNPWQSRVLMMPLDPIDPHDRRSQPLGAAAPRPGLAGHHEHPARACWPKCQLVVPQHIPLQARYPVIDSHNHYWNNSSPEALVEIMDQVGVRIYFNLTGNVDIRFDDQGYTYTLKPGKFSDFKETVIDHYPDRFKALTMSCFAQWDDDNRLDMDNFVERTIDQLEADIRLGACGLKVLKQLGLQFKDRDGTILRVDDERLDPIWQRAGELEVPVLIHVGDPEAFFERIDERNEHFITLKEFPGWSFYNSRYSGQELRDQRDRMIARHPKTQFILAHMANYPENLESVARLLDTFPNVHLDFSARIDELGRQPYSARDFMIQYQDRILFGVDMPASAEVYQCHFRFLETRDECFEYPNYVGGWDLTRWKICGLYLPDEALKKIYYLNALRLYPGIDPRKF